MRRVVLFMRAPEGFTMSTAEARSMGVVVVSPDELERIVEGAVRRALERRIEERERVWLDSRDAASLLKVSTRQVAKLAKSGELAHTKVGKLLRFRRDDVLALLENRSEG